MVCLGRWVRFSVDPFLEEDGGGANSYASRPAGEGLALFLELAIELTGPIDPQTGLLVNVNDIDRIVRRFAVPVFAEEIRRHLRRGEHISLGTVAGILRLVHEHLTGPFPSAQVDRLCLKLNPFRKLAMDARAPNVVYFSEKFEFAATHTLWNSALSEERNREIFGKCAHRGGHGHNYIVEVSIEMPADAPGMKIGLFQSLVDSQLIELVDHKNLNLDVPAFADKPPTVENLAVFAWEHLVGKFDPARLHCVTVWESDRTWCSYYGS